MKNKIIIALITFLPFATFAGIGRVNSPFRGKGAGKLDIHITIDKNGKTEITGLTGDLKDLEKDINKALKDVTIQINDGKEKHEINFKAEIKIK